MGQWPLRVTEKMAMEDKRASEEGREGGRKEMRIEKEWRMKINEKERRGIERESGCEGEVHGH